jgi:hypothetical protein
MSFLGPVVRVLYHVCRQGEEVFRDCVEFLAGVANRDVFEDLIGMLDTGAF